MNNCPVVLYTAPDGTTQLDVKPENETVWLTQAQMSVLFNTTSQNITMHIRRIYKEEELFVRNPYKFELRAIEP